MKSKFTLEEIAKRIVKLQLKYPKRILWIFVAINLMLLPGIFNLINNLEPSLERVLPQDVTEIQTMNLMRSEFGADMVYLIVYANSPVYDVRSPEYVEYLNLISQRFETHSLILESRGIHTLVKDVNSNRIPESKREVENLLNIHPLTSEFVAPDYSFSIVSIRTDSGSNAKLIDEVISSIENDISDLEEFNPGTTYQVTGFGAIDRATFSVILTDFAKITLVSMAAIAVVVLLTFKSLVRGMMPMLIVMNALVWTMGIVGYFGLTLTVVSMVAAAMIMGLGIDFGIHQVHSYFELRKSRNPKESLSELMQELLRAMLGASLTTMAGFLALLFGVLPAMKTLGIILALGIFTTLIGAVFLLPVVIYLYDSKKSLEV